jgi:hypothetical protein
MLNKSHPFFDEAFFTQGYRSAGSPDSFLINA